MNRSIETETKKENLKAYNKLLDLQEYEEKGVGGSYYYYADGYGNQYRVYTKKQKNGKFSGKIWNRRSKRITKEVSYKKRKMVKAFMLRKLSQANAKWQEAEKGRQTRKEQRDALKPKLTVKEQKARKIQSHLTRLQANIKRNESKMRRCGTRIKTDKKKIQYYLKRLDNL